MKKIVFISLIALTVNLGMVMPAYAQKSVDRVTPWNKFTDFFATVGKDKSEKTEIRRMRKKARRDARQFKARQKKSKETQKKMNKQKNNIMKKIKTKKMPHGRGGVDAKKK